MTFILKYSYYKNFKNLFWILSFLFFLSLQALLFPITTSACSKAFQEITPEQLKARLSLIAENKTEDIQNMNIDPSIPYVLTFNSKTGIKFQITTDSSLTEPAIVFSSSSKILKIPSLDWLHGSSSDNLIKSWLIGHEIHPYTSPSKNIQHTEKPSFEQLIELLISKNIFTHQEWKQQRENDPDLKHIPQQLSVTYKEWGENGGWEYVRKQANREKNTDEKITEN